MDRSVVTSLVEDYWRTIIPAARAGGSKASSEAGDRFEERVNQIAASLEPMEAAAFTQHLEAERERLMSEYQADPVALKRRLGISLGIDAPRQHGRQSRRGGNLVGRTIVRATIWETIRSLFRTFR